MSGELETFTIIVSQNKNKDGLENLWTTEQLVRGLLEKGSLLNVSSVVAHPSRKSK